mmetsp:Transcript_4328/g.6222  ORF Transcript_4328/g.6222 Transcript_4328/m.6222 type:complete len:252 (+) Transcript_4328:3592-4347(+)
MCIFPSLIVIFSSLSLDPSAFFSLSCLTALVLLSSMIVTAPNPFILVSFNTLLSAFEDLPVSCLSIAASFSGLLSTNFLSLLYVLLPFFIPFRDGDGTFAVTSTILSFSSSIFTCLSVFVTTIFEDFLGITSSVSSRGPTSEDAAGDISTIISDGIPFIGFFGFSFDSFFSGEETSLLFAAIMKSSISSISARMFLLLRKPPSSSSGALSALLDLFSLTVDSVFLAPMISSSGLSIVGIEEFLFGEIFAFL